MKEKEQQKSAEKPSTAMRASTPGLIVLKEGDPCPHCKIGKITRGPNGDLECQLCGYGRVPRRC